MRRNLLLLGERVVRSDFDSGNLWLAWLGTINWASVGRPARGNGSRADGRLFSCPARGMSCSVVAEKRTEEHPARDEEARVDTQRHPEELG